MNYREFLDMAGATFGCSYSIYKEKAGYLMLNRRNPGGGEPQSEEAIGPDIGHSCQARVYGITYEGWAYIWFEDTWLLVRDGYFSWRMTPINPFPQYREAAPQFSIL